MIFITINELAMQDTTSSAMTEVALGLSMAFFTLLIVALLSMSVPKENFTKAISEIPEDIKKNEAINIKNNIKENNKDEAKQSNENDMQFAFYFNNKLYDKTLAIRTIESFTKNKALVIAVDPTLAFAEVFTLRQKIQHPQLSITTVNKAWNTRLQQTITVD